MVAGLHRADSERLDLCVGGINEVDDVVLGYGERVLYHELIVGIEVYVKCVPTEWLGPGAHGGPAALEFLADVRANPVILSAGVAYSKYENLHDAPRFGQR